MKLGLVFALALAATPAFADENTLGTKPTRETLLGTREEAQPFSSWWAAAVLGVCAIAAAYVHMKSKKAPKSDDIELLSSRSLGGKARVALIRTHGRDLLVSVTDRGVSLISEFPEAPDVSFEDAVEATASDAPDTQDLIQPTPRAVTQSGAVAGLLQLREKQMKKKPTQPAAWSDDLARDLFEVRK